MNKRYLSLASIMTLCLLLLLMGGCGSSSNKEGETAAVAVGDRLCVQCHSAVTESLTGQTLMAQYENSSPHRDSAHANSGNGCEACHGNASQHQGIGPIVYPNPYANSGARCADCHAGNYAGNFSTKFASSKHANNVLEESATCQRCHTHEGAVMSNLAGYTGDYDVLENKAYQTVPIPQKGWTAAFKCQTCHEHGAGLRAVKARYSNPFNATDPANGTIVAWDPNFNREVDQFDLCTSCHTYQTNRYATGAVSGGRAVQDVRLTVSGTPAHTASGKPATVKAGHHETSWYRVIPTTHYDNPATGLDANNVALAPGNVVEGYVIRNNKETPCFDCHAHEANAGTRYGQTTTPTIYTDWAQSGHAGGLLKAKYLAATGKTGAAAVDSVFISGVADVTGSTDYADAKDASGNTITITRKTNAAQAWSHYQWEKTLNAAGASDRGTCQRCHTATGAANYLTNPAAYDYKANDFSHLSGWVKASTGVATVPSPQQEVLYCWGCHKNAAIGTLRTPGAIKAEYNFHGSLAVFPDVGQSNICIACHSGMQSGESLDTITNFANASFVNSHYIAVAGLMYVKSGFTGFIDPNTVIGTSTYGKSLTSDADGGALTSTHRRLGTTAINNDSHNPAAFVPGKFDANGPCVNCHMQGTGQPTRSSSHTFEINWKAFDEICIKCHDEEGGVPLTEANFKHLFIEEQAIPFQNALALGFAKLLANYNISYNQSAYPYFYDLSIGPTAAVRDWTRGGALSQADAKKLMGACFNLNILQREPAAYVHARTYARRLLYDSIDFLDDRQINMSTGATARAWDPVKYVKGPTANTGGTTESFKYLAGYNRTTNAWNALERP